MKEKEITTMSEAIRPRSDQTNADDLITGPITVTITAVKIVNTPEQPVILAIDGDRQPLKPCKTTSRILCALWGSGDDDMSQHWVGRRITIFRDPSVRFGGEAVGGIRVSHVSHIDKETVLLMTTGKGKKTKFTIKPIVDEPAKEPKEPPPSAETVEGVKTVWKSVASRKGTVVSAESWQAFVFAATAGRIKNPLASASWTAADVAVVHAAIEHEAQPDKEPE